MRGRLGWLGDLASPERPAHRGPWDRKAHKARPEPPGSRTSRARSEKSVFGFDGSGDPLCSAVGALNDNAVPSALTSTLSVALANGVPLTRPLHAGEEAEVIVLVRDANGNPVTNAAANQAALRGTFNGGNLAAFICDNAGSTCRGFFSAPGTISPITATLTVTMNGQAIGQPLPIPIAPVL